MSYITRSSPDPIASLTGITGLLTRMAVAAGRELRRRRAVRDLSHLDDDMLRDIGIVRSEIGFAARNQLRR